MLVGIDSCENNMNGKGMKELITFSVDITSHKSLTRTSYFDLPINYVDYMSVFLQPLNMIRQ